MLIVSDLISTDFLWVSQFLKKKKKKEKHLSMSGGFSCVNPFEVVTEQCI